MCQGVREETVTLHHGAVMREVQLGTEMPRRDVEPHVHSSNWTGERSGSVLPRTSVRVKRPQLGTLILDPWPMRLGEKRCALSRVTSLRRAPAPNAVSILSSESASSRVMLCSRFGYYRDRNLLRTPVSIEVCTERTASDIASETRKSRNRSVSGKLWTVRWQHG